MQALIINSTDCSPKIIFNPKENVFEISGDSRPENANEFYSPVLKWLDNYKAETAIEKPVNKLSFKLDFEYLNSISIKYAFEILKRIEAIKHDGSDVEVLWYYNKRDEDIMDNGHEFTTLVDVPMHVIPKD